MSYIKYFFFKNIYLLKYKIFQTHKSYITLFFIIYISIIYYYIYYLTIQEWLPKERNCGGSSISGNKNYYILHESVCVWDSRDALLVFFPWSREGSWTPTPISQLHVAS